MKKLLIFILIICICFNAILLSSCQKTAENKEKQETETEEVKLDSNTEIVDLALIDKLEKGMTYEQVTKILNNPGYEVANEYYVYRLENSYGLFIDFNPRLNFFKVEPLVDPSVYNRIVQAIEKNGEADILIDDLGSAGVMPGSQYGLYRYVLSDGRIVDIDYENDGHVIIGSTYVVEDWLNLPG